MNKGHKRAILYHHIWTELAQDVPKVATSEDWGMVEELSTRLVNLVRDMADVFSEGIAVRNEDAYVRRCLKQTLMYPGVWTDGTPVVKHPNLVAEGVLCAIQEASAEIRARQEDH